MDATKPTYATIVLISHVDRTSWTTLLNNQRVCSNQSDCMLVLHCELEKKNAGVQTCTPAHLLATHITHTHTLSTLIAPSPTQKSRMKEILSFHIFSTSDSQERVNDWGTALVIRCMIVIIRDRVSHMTHIAETMAMSHWPVTHTHTHTLTYKRLSRASKTVLMILWLNQ